MSQAFGARPTPSFKLGCGRFSPSNCCWMLVREAGRGRMRSLEEALDESATRLESLLVSEESTPSQKGMRAERLIALADSLATLPEDQRTALRAALPRRPFRRRRRRADESQHGLGDGPVVPRHADAERSDGRGLLNTRRGTMASDDDERAGARATLVAMSSTPICGR